MSLRHSSRPGRRRRPGPTPAASSGAPKAAEAEYRILFDANPDPMWVFDAKTLAFLAVNEAAVRHYGYSREEFLGMTLPELAPARGRDHLVSILPALEQRGRHAAFAVHRRSDGTLIDVETEWSAIDFGERRAFLVRIQDVTEERRLGRGALASAQMRAITLSHLGRKLGACETPSQVARVIARGAAELWTWNECAVGLYDAVRDRVRPVLRVERGRSGGWTESAEAAPERPPDPWERRILSEGSALLNGGPAQVPTGSEEPPLPAPEMLAPIREGYRILGFVRVRGESSVYDEADLASLESLADFCGEALKRIEATEDLRRSERQLREAQAAGRIGSWEWDLVEGRLQWSDELYRIFGVARADFEGTLEAFLARVDAEDRDRVAAIVRQALEDHQPFEVEYRIRRGEGEVRTVAARGEFVFAGDGPPRRAIGVAQDITDRKRADAELHESRERLVALSKRLIEVQETERRRIARELHDEIGQALTALKINLLVARRPGDEDPERDDRLADSLRIIETAIRQVRDISLALRPSLLDDIGLVSALRWYVDSQAQRSGLEASFEAEPAEIRVASHLEIGCYRIVQEALTNVVRHAHATRVEARIERAGKKLRLSIRDDGVGFDVAAARQRAHRGTSLGLLTMSERARLLGGWLAIRSSPGRGVEIRVTLPLDER